MSLRFISFGAAFVALATAKSAVFRREVPADVAQHGQSDKKIEREAVWAERLERHEAPLLRHETLSADHPLEKGPSSWLTDNATNTENASAATRGGSCGPEYAESYLAKVTSGEVKEEWGNIYPFNDEHCMASGWDAAQRQWGSESCSTPGFTWMGNCDGSREHLRADVKSSYAGAWLSSVNKASELCTKCSTSCEPWTKCAKNRGRFLYYFKGAKDQCKKECHRRARSMCSYIAVDEQAAMAKNGAGLPTSGAVCQCGCGNRTGCPTGQCEQPSYMACRGKCRPCCVGAEITRKCTKEDPLYQTRDAKIKIISDIYKRKAKNCAAVRRPLVERECVKDCVEKVVSEATKKQLHDSSWRASFDKLANDFSGSIDTIKAKVGKDMAYRMAHVNGALERADQYLSEEMASRQCQQSSEYTTCTQVFTPDTCKTMMC